MKLPCKALQIRNIKLTMFFDYELSYGNFPFSFSTLNFIDVDTPLGASFLQTKGSLNLKQKTPLYSGSFSSLNLPKTLSLINNATVPFDLNDLEINFLKTNFTTEYDYHSNILPFASSRELEINVEIDIPVFQTVLFRAPYLYAFKIAWIRYFCILVPVSIFIYFVMFFTFKMGVLDTIRMK